MRTRLAVLAGGILMAAGSSVPAHHSFTIFDTQHPLELTGTVQEFRFTSPHSFIILAVKAPDGSPMIWSLEGASPSALVREGWSSRTLKSGDEITDEIYQFRADTAQPTERKFLLSLDTSKMDVSKGKRKDGLYPVSWVSKFGKGRTFYCSLGHMESIYWNPVVLKHYLAGIQYALGDLEADALPTAK